jgi:hypothetical protein
VGTQHLLPWFACDVLVEACPRRLRYTLKPRLIAALFACSHLPLLMGQGTLNFYNRGNGFAAPITDARSGQRLDGVAWKAQLYYAAGRVVDESMVIPARPATDFRTGPNAGYVVPLTIVLDDVSSGALVTVQVRAWNTAAGTTFEQAAGDASGVVGRSNIQPLVLVYLSI